MPTIYTATELTDQQREVWTAIVTIGQICKAQPTREAIANFSGLSKTKVSETIRSLKAIGLVQERRVKG